MNRVLLPQQIDNAAPLWGALAHRLDGQTMGTTWQVRWVALGPLPEDRVRAAVQQELDLVVNQMSTWLPNSDLECFNRADAGTQHAVPEAMAEVLQAALWLADVSGGAFNPAAGALVNLWGFAPGCVIPIQTLCCRQTKLCSMRWPLTIGAACAGTVPTVSCINPVVYCWISLPLPKGMR